MSDNSPNGFTVGDAEVRAFLSAIAPYLVALLPPGGDVGTGTLVRWKSLQFVLTAKHNLNGTKTSEIRFCFYPGGNLRDGPMIPQDHRTLYRGLALPVGDAPIVDEVNDVVAIPLRDERLPGAAAFYELQPVAPTINDGATVILAGFAGDNSFPLAQRSRAVGVTVQTGRFNVALNSRRDLSSKYDEEDHFLLPYTRSEEGIRPHGISGAGAWCNANCPGDVWSARPLLAGVQTSWFPTSRLLLIVRMERILSMLEAT